MFEEALQIAEKRSEAKGKGEKERYTHLNAEFQRIARRDKKAFLSDKCKEMEENDRIGNTSDLFKKIRDTKGTFREGNGTPLQYSCLENPWMEVHDIIQEAGIKTIPKKKKCKKAKWLSEEALQIAEKRREAKGKRKKGRYTHLKAEF